MDGSRVWEPDADQTQRPGRNVRDNSTMSGWRWEEDQPNTITNGMKTGIAPLGLPGANGGGTSPSLYSIPGAANAESQDALERAFTREELDAMSARAVGLRDDQANLGETGDRLYREVFDKARQEASERLSVLKMRGEQESQQEKARLSARDQRTKTLAELQAKVPQLRQQMGDELLKEQQHSFERMNPIIEQRLNALGLLQSGALPEAQAKYQADLESQRQARLGEFEIGANQNLQLNMPWDISEQDLGLAADTMANDMDLQRAMLQRSFSNSDALSAEIMQRELAAQAAAQANKQRIAGQQGAIISGLFQLGGAGISAGMGGAGGMGTALGNARIRRGVQAGSGYNTTNSGGAYSGYV